MKLFRISIIHGNRPIVVILIEYSLSGYNKNTTLNVIVMKVANSLFLMSFLMTNIS